GMKETVLDLGTLHLDMVGKPEATLEAAGGDSLMEKFNLVLLLLALAGDGQGPFLDLDVEIGRAEACDRHGDAVGILAGSLDIVGGIGRGFENAHLVHHLGEAIDTDGTAIKGGKVEQHGNNLL